MDEEIVTPEMVAEWVERLMWLSSDEPDLSVDVETIQMMRRVLAAIAEGQASDPVACAKAAIE